MTIGQILVQFSRRILLSVEENELIDISSNKGLGNCDNFPSGSTGRDVYNRSSSCGKRRRSYDVYTGGYEETILTTKASEKLNQTRVIGKRQIDADQW